MLCGPLSEMTGGTFLLHTPGGVPCIAAAVKQAAWRRRAWLIVGPHRSPAVICTTTWPLMTGAVQPEILLHLPS